jgi:endo-1,4-beta-xylanase
LRAAGQRAGLRIGTAVEPEPLREDPAYGAALLTHFSQITPENAMKLGPLRPTLATFDFSGADALVEFAMQHGLAVHGHTLVWDRQLPAWLSQRAWTRPRLLPVLREHIHAVVSRYRGRVARWDVVNEALDENGGLRHSIWRTSIGDDYVELAFRWANEADPDARLFYNEFGAEGRGAKADGVLRLVRRLLELGVPLHGVGLQMHVSGEHAPDPAEVVTNMRRMAALGLELHVSEMDVRLPVPPTPDAVAAQARTYASIMQACLAVDACRAFTTWGVGDRYSWIPRVFRAFGAALVLDHELQRKPAYDGLLAVLLAAPASRPLRDVGRA